MAVATASSCGEVGAEGTDAVWWVRRKLWGDKVGAAAGWVAPLEATLCRFRFLGGRVQGGGTDAVRRPEGQVGPLAEVTGRGKNRDDERPLRL